MMATFFRRSLWVFFGMILASGLWSSPGQADPAGDLYGMQGQEGSQKMFLSRIDIEDLGQGFEGLLQRLLAKKDNEIIFLKS